MNIQQLNPSRIMISLCNKELEKFDLTFEKLNMNDYNSKIMIEQILNYAESKTGIVLKDKRLVIETMKYEQGCLMLITIVKKHRHKQYKVKARSNSYAFYFGNAENMLKCIERLYVQNEKNVRSCILYDGKGYYLVLINTIPHDNFIFIVKEYCLSCRKGKFYCMGLKEKYKLLVSFDAINKVGKILSQK